MVLHKVSISPCKYFLEVYLLCHSGTCTLPAYQWVKLRLKWIRRYNWKVSWLSPIIKKWHFKMFDTTVPELMLWHHAGSLLFWTCYKHTDVIMLVHARNAWVLHRIVCKYREKKYMHVWPLNWRKGWNTINEGTTSGKTWWYLDKRMELNDGSAHSKNYAQLKMSLRNISMFGHSGERDQHRVIKNLLQWMVHKMQQQVIHKGYWFASGLSYYPQI